MRRAYFVYPIRPGLVEATFNFAHAAREAGVEYIVNMSQRSARPDALSSAALHHWLGERLFEGSGIPVTHLRPTYFADWLLYMRKMIRDGRMSVPFGPTGRHAPIAAEDQGSVIAALLANPEGHAGETYSLFGPEEMTAPEIALTISETLGRHVRYEQISALNGAGR